MTDKPIVRDVHTYQGTDLPTLDIDPAIRDVTDGAIPRHPNHEARVGEKRKWADFAALQQQNIDDLITGQSELGRPRGIERPIYVWRHGEQLTIVDGIKTYLAAQKHKCDIEVWELKFDNMEQARLWRWYVNVGAATQFPEDVRVWRFLEQFPEVVEAWRAQGRRNQGTKKLASESERINWRELAAQRCLTTVHHVNAVYDLRREAEWAASQNVEELDGRDKELIKLIEDGVRSVLSGSRPASSVNSDIKGGATRTSQITKGKVNEDNHQKPTPEGALNEYDPTFRSQIIVADSLALIQKLPEGAFKYMMGSPPYYGADVNYGFDIPWLRSWPEYSETIRTYIREAHRIIPVGGGIILNVDDTRDRQTHQWNYHTQLIRDACLELGMYDAGLICWSKQNIAGKKHAKGSRKKACLRPNHEYVLAFFKGRPVVDFPTYVYGEHNFLTLSTWLEDSEVEEINEEHWAAFSNFWEIAPSNDPAHPATYPNKLVRRMLMRFTGAGDTILDPWLGIGTTAIQCIMMGRNFIGIEAGKGYAAIALENIAKAEKAVTELTLERQRRLDGYLKSKFVMGDSPPTDDESNDEDR